VSAFICWKKMLITLNGNFFKGVTAEHSEATNLDDGSLILS